MRPCDRAVVLTATDTMPPVTGTTSYWTLQWSHGFDGRGHPISLITPTTFARLQ